MIDLHTHSKCSDGDLSPEELLQMAEKRNLTVFSISDHDTVDAYKNLDVKKYYSGRFITGVELTCNLNGKTIEVLGYGFDVQKMLEEPLIKNYKRETREDRHRIMAYLKKAADHFSLIYTSDLSSDAAAIPTHDIFFDDVLSYAQNKETLDQLMVQDRSTFYRRHIRTKESPFYLISEESSVPFETAAMTIKNAGGFALLAHAGKYFGIDYEALTEESFATGLLDGFECMHKEHTRAQIDYLIAFCDTHGLLKSGGSDLHRNSPELLGIGSKEGDVIPESLATDLLKRIEER